MKIFWNVILFIPRSNSNLHSSTLAEDKTVTMAVFVGHLRNQRIDERATMVAVLQFRKES